MRLWEKGLTQPTSRPRDCVAFENGNVRSLLKNSILDIFRDAPAVTYRLSLRDSAQQQKTSGTETSRPPVTE